MICTSRAFLEGVAAELRAPPHATAASKALAVDVDVAAASHARPLTLFRSLDELDLPRAGRVAYAAVQDLRVADRLAMTNCHSGQRKLVYGLLAFVAGALARLKCRAADAVVVYAGASGLAGAIAADVFPGLRLVMYDPDPSVVDLIPAAFPRSDVAVVRTPGQPPPDARLVVHTGAAGWFDDAVAARVRASAGADGRRVLFVSDVRAETGEDDIVADMLRQQAWAVATGSEACLLKFRLPYVTAATAPAVRRRYLDGLPPGLAAPRNERGIPYLSGRLMVQTYAPQKSAELRLAAFRGRARKYAVAAYDPAEVEDKMAVFNAVFRSHALFDPGDARTREALSARAADGLPPTYDLVLQARVEAECPGPPAETRRKIDDAIASIAGLADKTDLACPLLSVRVDAGVDAEALAHVVRCFERVRGRLRRSQAERVARELAAVNRLQRPNNRNG